MMSAAPGEIAVRSSERMLIAALEEVDGAAARRVLCTSLGRGQLAAAAAVRFPRARVVCHFLDVYLASQSRACQSPGPENLSTICQADFPPDEIDLAMLPFTAAGHAELTREWLQQAHQALAPGGRLLAATDNPRDTWLGQQLRKLCDRVLRRAEDRAALYLAVKDRPLKKFKNFTCEFAFRDRGRLIRAVSRPGVFSHRRVDPGTRALLEVMEIAPGDRVFDMGCGSGVAALAAAMRAPGVAVYALDSNPRAVQCTMQGAALNGRENVAASLDAEGTCDRPGSYDVFLANPPYYSNYRIAEIFLDAGRRALRPGGTILVVAKRRDWYLEAMPARFDRLTVTPVKDYLVISAVQPE
jgi:16S rRNA (guanine1207-N2)-methyltransferase